MAAGVIIASDRHTVADLNHLTALRRNREGIDLRSPAARRILMKAGMGSPHSSRPRQQRLRLKRIPQEGMLNQVDGNSHP